MTLLKLENYYDTHNEIQQLTEHIQELRTKVESASSSLGDGQPRRKDYQSKEKLLVELLDLEKLLEDKVLSLIQMRKEVEKHLDDIEDSMKRQIMRKRFIEGKKWLDVADEVGYSEFHVKRLTQSLRTQVTDIKKK